MAKTQSETDRKVQEELKSSGSIPAHIAVIMDGNGRWAKKHGLPRVAGHQRGIETVREIVEASTQLGVKYLTLYTFSTENWRRPRDEVSTLMRLIVSSLRNETDELHANNVRLWAIGDRKSLPSIVQKELNEAIEKTRSNTKLNLILALSYSGRWEITEAIRKVAEDVMEGRIRTGMIDEDTISSHLETKEIPDPDLLIRSGGEFRVSNFLLWQIAYTELYISDVLWPDFDREKLYEAIRDFQRRERRYGRVSEQLKSKDNGSTDAKKHLKHTAGV